MEEKQSSIFTQKSLEKISSPEQLDEYLKVTNPSVWIVFGGIILLLVGVFVWGALGTLDVKKDAVAVSQDGTIQVYLPAGREDLKEGLPIIIGDEQFEAKDVRWSAKVVDENFPELAAKYGNFSNGEVLDMLVVDKNYPEGVYKVSVVTDRISPIKLIFN